jgi:DNA repair protein RadA/Sms
VKGPRSSYRCQQCGALALRWAGRCPACGEWNTLVEDRGTHGHRPGAPRGARTNPGSRSALGGTPAGGAGTGVPRTPRGGTATGSAGGPRAPRPRPTAAGGALIPPAASLAVALASVDGLNGDPHPTGIAEFDRVLGGGLVPGSVTLIGGEPGIGKSTLLLQALGQAAQAGARALLVSAEESPSQVRRRADRLGVDPDGLWIVGETDMESVREAVEDVDPELMVVDSIQTVWDAEFESAPGSVGQVRGCAQALVDLAKSRAMSTVLVGHVTKDGGLAGPRTLEHVVDTVVNFEGDRHHALRLLRAAKHRFGPIGELGVLEMTEAGLAGVADASGLFLADRTAGSPGSAVFPAVEGQRPLLVELQALVMESQLANPRRQASGLDGGRLALLMAVLSERAAVRLANSDVYASAVGGVRVTEPGADLALCLALASARSGRPLPASLVAVGEVGLGGELRHVSHLHRRLAESARLGFTQAMIPAVADVPAAVPGLRTLPVASLSEAVALVAPT